MSNAWGRSPQKNSLSNYKMIALWVFIIGAVICLLFPSILSFFGGNNSAAPAIGEIVLPSDSVSASGVDFSSDSFSLPSVFDGLYEDDTIATGYWIMFVGDNELKQLNLSSGSYDFIMSVVEKDSRTKESPGDLPMLTAANGQIKKYLVSDRIYEIIINLKDISDRAGII